MAIPAWVEKYQVFFSQMGLTLQQAAMVAPAALLHLTPVLLNHRHSPHDQHQRLSLICFMSSTRVAATATGSTNI